MYTIIGGHSKGIHSMTWADDIQESRTTFKIVPVHSSTQLEAVRDLFKQYSEALDFELNFQNFQKELSGLPGEYASPDGLLLLAFYRGESVGCVALKRLDNKTCEMKRLFVRPEHRGRGIGKALAVSVINKAIRQGYNAMRLDTIDNMNEAVTLYESLGFERIEAYRYNPMDGALFFELRMK